MRPTAPRQRQRHRSARTGRASDRRASRRPTAVDFAPDGTRVYISNEADSTLDVVDRKTGKIVKKVPLSGHPNNIASRGRRPGRHLHRGRQGRASTSSTPGPSRSPRPSRSNGRMHNVYVTATQIRGRGSVRHKFLSVLDLKTEQVAGISSSQGRAPDDDESAPTVRPAGSSSSCRS